MAPPFSGHMDGPLMCDDHVLERTLDHSSGKYLPLLNEYAMALPCYTRSPPVNESTPGLFNSRFHMGWGAIQIGIVRCRSPPGAQFDMFSSAPSWP
ncbi:hypothetical protein T310_5302 [Rasamsonia emersonii CBS 393.64]|uniref:Uncharacterized protein n=1 Tax=Rasamsonia emersonii (strain ATCC 16479 / CBS 393.64 / IMI 116815) TaxID=1408163 RepID=A0A0F4YS78_RASE3|nr:hypothetical protein T310_5302 [Rasamsonia emersonii CBS 393.64]KKA20686.1 hypothetical protein T310_5302 [Rasamsonia emersonii CBS 393.64]